MQSEWEKYLNSAQLVGARGFHADARAKNSRAAAALNHLAAVCVDGDDAETFLQAQLTNDLAALKTNAAQLTAYCNPKGRALGVFWLMRRAHGFIMLIPSDIAKDICARMRMYVLRAKVEITAADNVAVGLLGDATARGEVYDLPGARARRVAFLSAPDAIELFNAHEKIYAEEVWRLLDIQSGVAFICAATTEECIPQMLNLDLTDGMSFHKGCYPGQEIIARLRYLGKIKQRTIRARIVGAPRDKKITAGALIFSARQPQTKSGKVLQAVQVGAGEYEILALLPSDQLDADGFFVGESHGESMTRLKLPYEIKN